MKNTLITLASVATLAVSANAQTLVDSFEGDALAQFTGSPGSYTSVNGTVISWSAADTTDFREITTFGFGASITNGTQAVGIRPGSPAGFTDITFSLAAIGANQFYSFEVLDLINNLTLTDSTGTEISFPFTGDNGSAIIDLTAGANSFTFSGQSSLNDNFAVDFITLTTVAVPEPSSTALLGLGALGLLARRKR